MKKVEFAVLFTGVYYLDVSALNLNLTWEYKKDDLLIFNTLTCNNVNKVLQDSKLLASVFPNAYFELFISVIGSRSLVTFRLPLFIQKFCKNSLCNVTLSYTIIPDDTFFYERFPKKNLKLEEIQMSFYLENLSEQHNLLEELQKKYKRFLRFSQYRNFIQCDPSCLSDRCIRHITSMSIKKLASSMFHLEFDSEYWTRKIFLPENILVFFRQIDIPLQISFFIQISHVQDE